MSLRRQASRAARYKEQTEILKQRRASLTRARGDLLRDALAASERLRDERRDREAEAAAALARAESALAQARLEAGEASTRRDALREALATLEASIARDDALLDANKRAAMDLAARRAALEREGRDFSSEQTRAARDLADLQERLERTVAEARAKSLAREEADRLASEAADACAALEAELEGTRTRALNAAGERVGARNARHEVDLAAERISASLSRLAETGARIGEELAGREREAGEAEREAARLKAAAAEASGRVAAIEEELLRLSASLAGAEAAREAARESAGALDHRLAALLETLRAREISVNEVRQALRGAGLAEHGALSDRIRPRAGWEDAVGLVLGTDSDALLASGDVRRAVDAMRSLSAARMVRADWRHETHAERPGDSLGWDAVLEGYAGLSPAERAALPATAFVESLEDASALSRAAPRDDVRDPRPRGRPRTRRPRGRAGRRGLRPLRAAARGRNPDPPPPRGPRRARSGGGRPGSAAGPPRFARGGPPGPARCRDRGAGRAQRLRRAPRGEARRSRPAPAGAPDDLRGARRLDRQRRPGSRRAVAPWRKTSAASPGPRTKPTSGRASFPRRSPRRARPRSRAPTSSPTAAPRPRSRPSAGGRWRPRATHSRRRTRRSSGACAEATEEEARIATRAAELTHEEAEARARQTANLAARETRAVEHSAAVETALEIASRVEVAEAATRTDRSALDAARESRFEAEVTSTRASSDLEHLVAQCREEFGVEPDGLEAPADASPEALAALEAEVARARRLDRAPGPGQRPRLRGVQGDVRAPRLPDDAARRPPTVDRGAPGVDPQDQRDVLRALRRGVRRDQRELHGRSSRASSGAARRR